MGLWGQLFPYSFVSWKIPSCCWTLNYTCVKSEIDVLCNFMIVMKCAVNLLTVILPNSVYTWHLLCQYGKDYNTFSPPTGKWSLDHIYIHLRYWIGTRPSLQHLSTTTGDIDRYSKSIISHAGGRHSGPRWPTSINGNHPNLTIDCTSQQCTNNEVVLYHFELWKWKIIFMYMKKAFAIHCISLGNQKFCCRRCSLYGYF